MTLEKVPGTVGKFRDTKTGNTFNINSWWEVDLFTQEFTLPMGDSSVRLTGRVQEDFVLSRLLYIFAAGVHPRDREIFRHNGRVIALCNENEKEPLFSLPALVLEYSTEAVAEIVRLILEGNAVAALTGDQLQVADAARVVQQGWKIAQPQLFKKDAQWTIQLKCEESCFVQGTFVGLGMAKRPVKE